jgi:isopenicillin-N epimerase
MHHRALFTLDAETIFLNHGSYGAAPRPVQEAQSVWRARMEAQPVRFMQRTFPPALERSRAAAAAFIGADPRDLVFVRNATSGVNAVISSLDLRPGDRILTTSHRYEAVGNTLAHSASRRGLHLDVVDLPVPLSGPDIVLERLAAAITERTRLIVVDQITSATALVLPVRRIAALAAARGCLLLVDGAHAPGHLELSVASIGADFWVGNLHKWPCAPKGAALLWVNREHHGDIHPAVISNFYGQGFHAEFDWCGTDDPSPWLCAVDAISLHEKVFGGADFRADNRALARAARDLLCEATGARPVAEDDEMTCALGAAILDRPAGDLYAQLVARGFEVPVIEWGEQTIVRMSAFSAYNHIDQYAQLAKAVRDLIQAG